jgi:quercetin dioxygenase-like cupin family protein
MKTTVFELHDGAVQLRRVERQEWTPRAEYEGKALERVRDVDVLALGQASMQLVEIAAGGSFAMHSSPDVAFCQIVRGRGTLGLPGGRELGYEAPELYVFLPDTAHDWHGVEEDTLLSVCIVRVARAPSGARSS